VAEALSRYLVEAKRNGSYKGIPISQVLYISHLLFVDDVLIFSDGSKRDVDKLCKGLALFKRATGMIVNEYNLTISKCNLDDEEARYISTTLPYMMLDFDDGINYLGFHLKPNRYRKARLALAFGEDGKKNEIMEP
jgi:hypothetical protein